MSINSYMYIIWSYIRTYVRKNAIIIHIFFFLNLYVIILYLISISDRKTTLHARFLHDCINIDDKTYFVIRTAVV